MSLTQWSSVYTPQCSTSNARKKVTVLNYLIFKVAFSKVIALSHWLFFFNSSFRWITHRNQPVETSAKHLASYINLIAYQYFPAIQETKVSLWIDFPIIQTFAIEICLDLGYWEIIMLSRCLLKDLFYFADSGTW